MESATDRAELPTPDAVLELIGVEDGSACAVLTPAIKTKLKEFASGQVLEVHVDDPSARMDVPAWCRLTGNELVATVEESPLITRFYLRKR